MTRIEPIFTDFFVFNYTKNGGNKKTPGLEPITHQGLDSFRLVYTILACDCPNWVDYRKRMEYEADSNPNKKEFDSMFNDSYYIERKETSDVPEGKAGMVVDFFGKLDTNRRLSKEDIYMDPEPIKGKVVMYSKFKIVKQ
jgi:hypothetical protein